MPPVRLFLCGAVFVVGCAPLASFRPSSALEGEPSYEVGAGVASLGPRPYVTESRRYTAQLWGSLEAEEWLILSAVGAFDDEAGLGGFSALAKPIRFDRFVAGVETELGIAWFGLALPLSVRLFDQTWIYTSPRIQNWVDELGGGIPFGLSAQIVPELSLRAEAQVSWAKFVYYNRRLHLGAAAVVHW